MATAIQKITLSSSRDIPFNKLVLSQSNVRRVKAGVSIEELAEDIARRTLLQSLNVRPVLDAEGAETGMFEIPAGGRRYRALELLVKQKRLAKAAPVPCVVRDPGTDILGEDDSLAENIQRAPLHPLDQFRAFLALREKGRSEEDIAAAFFVGVNVVKQRLRLASVAPALLDVYAEDGMSLEQLMAFTVTADHARQEQVWQAISGSWQNEPYQIRRMLTEKTVRASDRRAVFVSLDAYEAAGGVVLRDLFQSDDGGWLEDITLLDGLVAEKLKAEAETIAAEGWKWIEVAIDFPYGRLLDAESEHLGEAVVQAFETEGLIGTAAAPAVLADLFHRIEDRLDGSPTLLIIDEGWLALDDEDFAGQLREWLKTLRKKNASVVFATQSLSDIDSSAIAPAIIESCQTRLLLPNERAIEPQIAAIYRRFGLNDRQIEILARAMPKRDYYCQSRRGNRLFELGLSEVALALCAASSKTDQAAIERVVAEHGREGFLSAWLHLRGVAWAADLIPNLNNLETQS